MPNCEFYLLLLRSLPHDLECREMWSKLKKKRMKSAAQAAQQANQAAMANKQGLSRTMSGTSLYHQGQSHRSGSLPPPMKRDSSFAKSIPHSRKDSHQNQAGPDVDNRCGDAGPDIASAKDALQDKTKIQRLTQTWKTRGPMTETQIAN